MNCAVLYQIKEPPERYGLRKPMKKGGYSDSGADIAFTLKEAGIKVITPVDIPRETEDLDWVFPDDKEGILSAIKKGADTFWLNTVLYDGHPIEEFLSKGYEVIGQEPKAVSLYDDKYFVNQRLREAGLDVVKEDLVSTLKNNLPSFPTAIKPILGRGSQGVFIVKNEEEYNKKLQELTDAKIYGTSFILEPYLTGTEVTIAVMLPGTYDINGVVVKKEDYWCLPVIERFNHIDGIAPYNGTVSVVNNSRVIKQNEILDNLCEQCAKAAKILNVKSVIRIDCRADENGKFYLFDVNLKPNMTGASRSHRSDQDSLVMIAARELGWEFKDLLVYMKNTKWTYKN